MAKLLEIKGLKKYFEIKKGFFSKPVFLKAVDGVSLEIKKGEAVSIVGESGCGKTTLGKTILRLYEPTGGKIVFEGRDITHEEAKNLMWYRRAASLVQQDPYGSLPSFFTIYKILEEPLIIHKVGTKEERREMIYKALEAVKLTPVDFFASKYPHMLSGGQMQRVCLARAIILKPKFIVADEPVSMLDASVRIEILKLMRELQEKMGVSFIYITHDLATTRYFSEKLMIMYAGKAVEKGPIEKVIADPLHPYTEALLNAIPDPEPENRKKIRHVPPGEPPNLVNPPPGCRFHPRCPRAMDICREKEPPEVKIGDRTVACWLYSEK
ncbi:MAG: oligopeptide ABC transporter ATP-binding protein [Thermoprotei archaeon]|mgnify:CR=1 FL=1|nr:MAG: oligopeptide ABC transporter ATP-binding protein [Thermoprotei archaeon]